MTHQEFIETLAQEFELAYLATGLKPIRRDWGDGVQNGCMVTALDVSEHGRSQPAVPLQQISFFRKRRRRVADHLARRFPQVGYAWWHEFVRYCIGGFDGNVTRPTQWLKRNVSLPCAGASPKLIGAAVADIVARRVFAPF